MMNSVVNNMLSGNIDPENNYYNSTSSHETFQNCKYYSISEFQSLRGTHKKDFLVLSFNIRSFNANFDKLSPIFNNVPSPDILVLCETWFNQNNVCEIPNYSSSHSFRNETNGRGGVSIYVKDSFSSHSVSEFCFSNPTIEINCMKVLIGDSWIFVLGIYRPQGDSISNFSEEIYEILSALGARQKKVILTGDVNVNLLRENTVNDTFLNCMHSFHLLPIISKPTRFPVITNHSPSLIDHIWTNSSSAKISGIISTDISDHCPIFVLMTFNSINSEEKIKISFRCRSMQNKELFYQKISNFDWNSIQCDNIDEYTQKFLHTINKIFCDCFPIKTKYISLKRFKNPWITNEILELIKLKSTYFLFLRQNLITQAVNNSLKNKVNQAVRKAKTEYLRMKFGSFRNDMRRTWDLIRTVLSQTKKNNTIKYILFNNVEVFDQLEMANLFNEYFCQIPVELEAKIPSSRLNPLDFVTKVDASIFLKPVSIPECETIIKKLNNSKCNIDTLPVTLFKEVSNVLSPLIVNLVNRCFLTGVFPDTLKIACVTPIYKKGDKNLISNYRPIAVVHYLSKIIEKLLFNRLSDFFKKFDVIHSNQFGFMPGKSTSDAMIQLIDFFYNVIDSKEYSIALFIDYQKAFDTVNHNILLKKLELYGIRGRPLELINSYLSNRSQFVKIGNSYSNKLSCNIGLPQGSTLAPLFFILYINDMHKISSKFHTVLFADDTTLLFRNKNFQDLVDTCNLELIKFKEWTNANKLSLNVNKTSAMVVSNRNYPVDFSIRYNDLEIEICREVTFLGVKLDHNLKFDSHCRHVSNKISKSIGILYKLSNYLSKNTLVSIYYSLVYPYLYYCNIVWGNTFANHLYHIVKLQKRAVRILCQAPFLSHSEPLFKNLKILTLTDVHKYQVLIYMYKHHDVLFENFSNHGYSTRNTSNIRSAFRRTVLSRRSIRCIGPNYWNNIPISLKCLGKIENFKYRLKIFFVSNYSA